MATFTTHTIAVADTMSTFMGDGYILFVDFSRIFVPVNELSKLTKKTKGIRAKLIVDIIVGWSFPIIIIIIIIDRRVNQSSWVKSGKCSELGNIIGASILV